VVLPRTPLNVGGREDNIGRARMQPTLLERIRSRDDGLRFYGLTPPKRGQDSEKLRDIAARQARRIASLAPDGLVLYDLQDEAARTGAARPFPFLPTMDPLDYSRDYLAELDVPRVLYKCVGHHSRESFSRWLDAVDPRDACVLVGAPSRAVAGPAGGFGLQAAYALAGERATPACLGGVAIAERHTRKLDEDERLASKHAAGCRFFISQTVFDAGATKSLLSDYAVRFARDGLPPVPFILSFSPCGSLKTMEFMKWLGISFPRWLENDLRHAPDILRKSVDLALQIFADIRAFAREKQIPLGINVESVSIRKEEIEASGELFAALSAH
jgi:hypothetical protein